MNITYKDLTFEEVQQAVINQYIPEEKRASARFSVDIKKGVFVFYVSMDGDESNSDERKE